ncbi:hypothetical protein L7F22_000656 [Adiantum nelumboides]|nr:hypothetical protein [Adiantum nelumboides]
MNGQYAEDEDFARIYDQIVNGQRHEHYTLRSDFLMMHGKLCVTKQLRPKVLTECHAPPYAGHRGIDATIKAIDTFFYWPTLRRDVDAFVRLCLVCQKVKFDRQKAPGLLQPLPIPDKPWKSITMDFIFYLPRTPTGNDGIWTIICKFSKQAHFVLVRKKIRSKHSYSCITSSSNMGCHHYLPLVEYAYNNTVHTSTGKAPFKIVEGGKKVPPILQTKDKIFEADKYVQNTDETYRKIKLALEKTQSKQKKAVDRHHHELVFSLGDWVLLRFEKTRLKLLEGWKIHNAFHVSLLRPFVGDVPEDMVSKEQPKVEDLDEILVPEHILAHKDRKVKGKVARRYLVKFKNYSPMDAKWMEEVELVDSPQLLQLYLEAFQLQPTVT